MACRSPHRLPRWSGTSRHLNFRWAVDKLLHERFRALPLLHLALDLDLLATESLFPHVHSELDGTEVDGELQVFLIVSPFPLYDSLAGCDERLEFCCQLLRRVYKDEVLDPAAWWSHLKMRL